MTPRAAVQDADFVISMVRDDEASRRVWLDPADGALAALPAHAVAIESSTITVAWAQSLAQNCRARDAGFLDAPVAGSRPQADAAQLIHLVGGERRAFDRAEPILKAMGSAVWYLGQSGSGAAMKLIVNALLGAQLAALAELLGYAERRGLDAARVVEVLSATPVCSPAVKLAADAMRTSVRRSAYRRI